MDNELYDYSPISERDPIHWPDGARVAFYVGLNVEHFLLGSPSTSFYDGTAALVPDPLNHGWRDYGARVGIWRLTEIFDRHGIRPSVLLNSDVTIEYPQIIKAGTERNWAWLAHGRNNSTLQAGMPAGEERAYLANVAETIVELNDLGLFTMRGLTGPQFLQTVKDQLDQLYADSASSGRVMALALHPFASGHPFRAKYLDQALAYITGHPGVWLTTSDEIAAHFAHVRPQAQQGQ
jgi:peptidoglycan/xylan/chitin deacetylase (PgdA/CDA1 family)